MPPLLSSRSTSSAPLPPAARSRLLNRSSLFVLAEKLVAGSDQELTCIMQSSMNTVFVISKLNLKIEAQAFYEKSDNESPEYFPNIILPPQSPCLYEHNVSPDMKSTISSESFSAILACLRSGFICVRFVIHSIVSRAQGLDLKADRTSSSEWTRVFRG